MKTLFYVTAIVVALSACSSNVGMNQPKNENELPAGIMEPVSGSGALADSWKNEIQSAPMPASMTK